MGFLVGSCVAVFSMSKHTPISMECTPVSPEGPIVITFQEDMLDLHFYASTGKALPYYSLARHYFEDLDSLTK